jgi:hypothetical protein
MATGVARINAAPGTRVQGLIVPNDAKDAATRPAASAAPKVPPAQPASNAKPPPK